MTPITYYYTKSVRGRRDAALGPALVTPWEDS